MKQLIIIFFIMSIPVQAIAQSVGYVVSFTGKAQIKRNNNLLSPDIGARLFKDDTVITGDNGRLRILFVDNSIVNVGPDSEINIKTYVLTPSNRDVLLSMIKGKIRFYVSKLSNIFNIYDIKTATSVIGIRGTDFIVDASNKGVTDVYVIKGQIALWNIVQNPSEAIKLINGMMSRVKDRKPPTLPIKYTEQDIKKLINETRSRLKTEIKKETDMLTNSLERLQIEKIEKDREIKEILKKNQSTLNTKIKELNQDRENISNKIDTQLKIEGDNIRHLINKTLE